MYYFCFCFCIFVLFYFYWHEVFIITDVKYLLLLTWSIYYYWREVFINTDVKYLLLLTWSVLCLFIMIIIMIVIYIYAMAWVFQFQNSNLLLKAYYIISLLNLKLLIISTTLNILYEYSWLSFLTFFDDWGLLNVILIL